MRFVTTALNVVQLVYHGIQWEKFRGSNNFAANCTCVQHKLHILLLLFPEMYATKMSAVQVTTPSGNYTYMYPLVQHIMAHLICSIVSRLAIIESQAELDQLTRSGIYWVDMNDINAEGTWVSSFTGGASFVHWGLHENINSENEDCGITKDGNVMGDAPCSNYFLAFICET